MKLNNRFGRQDRPVLPAGYRYVEEGEVLLPTDESTAIENLKEDDPDWMALAEIEQHIGMMASGLEVNDGLLEGVVIRRRVETDTRENIEAAKKAQADHREAQLKAQQELMKTLASVMGLELPKPPASAGEGYRFVEVGETLLPTDELCRPLPGGRFEPWEQLRSGSKAVGLKVHTVEDWDTECPYGFYRRALRPEDKKRKGGKKCLSGTSDPSRN